MSYIYRIYDESTKKELASGTSKECAEKLGVSARSVTRMVSTAVKGMRAERIENSIKPKETEIKADGQKSITMLKNPAEKNKSKKDSRKKASVSEKKETKNPSADEKKKESSKKKKTKRLEKSVSCPFGRDDFEKALACASCTDREYDWENMRVIKCKGKEKRSEKSQRTLDFVIRMYREKGKNDIN